MTKGIGRSRVRYAIVCKHCKNEFTVPSYRKDTATYCSRRCLALDARVETKSTCAECGKEFTHISSRANKAKYCSPVCYHRAVRKQGKTTYACAHCDVSFQDSASRNRKFCSKQCVNKAAKETWVPTFSTVRKSMLRRGMLTCCERCGYDAAPEILGVHHKDRNQKNNDLANLEVLCPNCHSLERSKHVAHGYTE